ncbi:probable protein phosphatase 2C 8 [Selaginella moellendorffii]|nr:probable protein phosphatase 2C 8 [Selaginella moellendorffii]XP_024535744.1 probable protein phosphatase 2C 8 [Selaginella moellendorffii]|eukprot:XP_002975042.2 probable protein phosphatase 2C 8 [Selaginella moellendorffii]
MPLGVCDIAAGMSGLVPSSSETTPSLSTPPAYESDLISSERHDRRNASSRTSSGSSLSSAGSSGALLDQTQQHRLLPEEQASRDQGGEGGEGGDCVAANDGFPSYGLVSFIGRRKEMEDAATIAGDFLSLPCDIARHSSQDGHHSSHHFFGVYDGHGGSQVAHFCKDRLHVALVEQIKESIALAGFASANEVTCWDTVWEKALESCFLKVDGEIDSMCLRPGNCDKCEVNTGVCCETVGSTAVVAVVSCCRIVIANCGDSRVVLCRGGRAIPLSVDHKPEKEDEMQRIEDAGGRVIFWNGYRVMGMLAMSRAIGDRYLDRFVIPNPDVKCVVRSDEDEFLVLASDGLWDVLTNEQVCEVTRMCLAGRCTSNLDALSAHTHGTETSHARVAAAYLTKLAYNRRSGDNISVLVVDLRSGVAAAAGMLSSVSITSSSSSSSSSPAMPVSTMTSTTTTAAAASTATVAAGSTPTSEVAATP